MSTPSDTPRTDLNCLTVETLRTMKGTGTQIVLAAVCRQLERELAAANARIAKLEKAGDRLHDAIWSVQDWNGTRVGDRADDWMRVYDEGKP